MSALETFAKVLRDARVAGGWTDEAVAKTLLLTLGLDDDGYTMPPETAAAKVENAAPPPMTVREVELTQALHNVREDIVNAPPEVIADTLWHGEAETVVDYIGSVIRLD